ncbi:flavin reductase family protein [Kribbella sp. NPDC058245]|uniref:flavin reductase family protein n=1 Tax=Kribbella sp. NPDC058245 TaxID=3346399 RepID=UPI0036EDCD9A
MFVAGGIGITPILPMLAVAAEAKADWSLLYLVRDRGAAVYLDELDRYGDRVHLHSDSAFGMVDLEHELTSRGGEGAEIYGCGPRGLLDALDRYGAKHRGARIVVERFSARPTETAGNEQPFTVVTSDGAEFVVGTGQSILAAAADVGIVIASSCREGYCGTCETKVVAGEPEHRDDFLSEEERAGGQLIMPCVSRARGSRIVLDLTWST